MAKITNKTLLVVGTELVINETTKTIRLVATGNLVAKDGVAISALYGKLSDLWTDLSYQDSDFPMKAIDNLSGQYAFGVDPSDNYNGWTLYDDTTRNMLRDGGWTEYTSAGAEARIYTGAIGLGAINSGAQPYYQLTSIASPVNFPFTDQCNAGVQVFGNATNGNFDTRAHFKAYVREQGKRYSDSVLTDTGKVSTGAYIVNFLLSNETDLKIQANDAAMSGAPYSGITIDYYIADQMKTIGAGSYPYRVIINGNGATLEQIYTKVQYLLRQTGNINTAGTASTVIGKTASLLLKFNGDTLTTSTGVFVDNTALSGIGNLELTDQKGVVRTYPVSSGISVTSLATGSRVKFIKVSDDSLLYQGSEVGGVVNFNDNTYVGAVSIEARKGSSAPYYLPWVTQINTVSGQSTTVTALQQLDQ